MEGNNGMEIKLFDVVKTLIELPEAKKGTVGTIVQVWKPNELYEVELVDEHGDTIDCVSLSPSDFVKLTKSETDNLDF